MKINGINFSDDGIEEYSLLELKEMKLQRERIQKMEVRNLRINVLHVIIEKRLQVMVYTWLKTFVFA